MVNPSTTRRVLLVDDEAALVSTFARFLRGRGVEVLTATSAVQALSVLERQDVDLVLTDVRMPGRTGLWLCGVVQERWPQVPVLLMTGADRTGLDWEGCSGEGVEILTKPFDLDVMLRAIQRALDR